MSLKFGDHVVLIHPLPNGKLERVNAIVLRSFVQPAGAEKASPKEAEVKRLLKDRNANPLPGGEYLDLAYPNLGLKPDGQPELTTSSPDIIFKYWGTVPPLAAGASLGWAPTPGPIPPGPVGPPIHKPPTPPVTSGADAEQAKLKAFLFANFKNETGNETPEACAIRLLSKKK